MLAECNSGEECTISIGIWLKAIPPSPSVLLASVMKTVAPGQPLSRGLPFPGLGVFKVRRAVLSR